MGEYADLFNEMYFDDLAEIDGAKYMREHNMIKNHIWTTGIGEEIHVKDMDKLHIENTINMLIRKHKDSKKIVKILRQELRKRK